MAIVRVVERFHANREKIADDFSKLFEGELNPVAPKAQRKVPVPEGYVYLQMSYIIFCMRLC